MQALVKFACETWRASVAVVALVSLALMGDVPWTKVRQNIYLC